MTVKSSASSLAQSHEKESTSITTTTKNLLKHHKISTAPIAESTYQGSPCSNKSNDDQNYKHLSAAGEHFARKKNEGEHTTLFRRLAARVGHPEGRDELQEGKQVADDEEAPVEEQYKHFSAAGEHFAKKRAEERSLKSPKKKEVVGGEESAESKSSLENGTESDKNETDPYKHLSAAGEHFARRKSNGESLPSLLRRMSSSFSVRNNSTATEDWDEEDDEADRVQHLSSAGEHFARKKAEKKKARRASKINKGGHASKQEEEEEVTEGHVLETSSDSSLNSYDLNLPPKECVQEVPVKDKSNDVKDIDDHAADSLDQAYDMVAQQLDDVGVETTLSVEEDGEAMKDEGNNTQNFVPNTAVDTTYSQLDQIQRTPAYTLHRDMIIGKGSYGHVCIASRGQAEGHFSSKTGTRKKFACKCISLPANPKHICKLQEEVNVLRVLRGHANVIRLYDVFVLENELLVITELGTGGDLFHLLATHPKHGVSEEYAAKTVSDMLSAVTILHSIHICHRDLKIENWVLKSGNLWSPLKLIDFGLSTHFTPGHKLSRVVGSSYYIAPEVLKKSYTEACDLWSLGVIVYMLLSGAPPFYGKNDEAIKSSIIRGEYSFPHELFHDVSEDAMAFVSCLLTYDEEKRYTAHQALNHPWLEVKCNPEQLHRCKAGAQVC